MINQVSVVSQYVPPKIAKEHSPVFLLGYHIKPVDAESCTVTCITNLSPDLKPLEADIASGKKLKQHIEELTQITDVSSDKKDKSMGKIKSLFGTTASYLYKAGASKATELLNSHKQETSVSMANSVESNRPKISSCPALSDIASLVKDIDFVHDGKEDVNIQIQAKQIIKVDLAFDPIMHSSLHINFSTEMDHLPVFGVSFTPYESANSSPDISSNHKESIIILPVSHILSSVKLIHCTLPVSSLPRGQFSVIFDNSTSKTSSKLIIFNACCQELLQGDLSLSIVVPRKSAYRIPILLQKSKRIKLSFDCQIEILFSISFEHTDKSQKKSILCPPTKFLSLKNSSYEYFDTSGIEGTLLLVWDNSSSILSSRNISFHVIVEY
jgi:hypothetical protein